MKRPITMLLMGACAITLTSSAYAQKGKDKKDDPKYTNYYKDVEEAIELKELAMEFSNGVSRMDFLKFKCKFTNNTSDFLLIDPEKFSIEVSGETVSPKERSFILKPNDVARKTIDVKEGAQFVADEFEVTVGGISVIPSYGKVAEAEPFKLPAATNSFTVGNFEVDLKMLRKETDRTWVKFDVRYTGDDYGILDQNQISVKTADGQEFATENKNSKLDLLEKGDKKGLEATFRISAKVVDMQFADLFIQWNKTFAETSAVEVEAGESVTFELDEELTKEKN